MAGIQIKREVPESFSDAKVLDVDGNEVRIGTFWEKGPALVIFIRHFACIGCTTQMLAISPRLEEIKNLGVQTHVVGNGRLQFLDGFIEKFNLEDRPINVYTDPSLNAYKQASLTRSVWHALGPRTWWDFIKAISKGIGQRTVQGDNLQLGGTLLIDENGKVRLFHKSKSVSNHSDPNEIVNSIYAYVGEKNPDLF
jgi:peroxiredoxin